MTQNSKVACDNYISGAMSNQMAPWVPLFIQSLNNNQNDRDPFVAFQFATTIEQISTDSSDKTYKPQVRTVVFRDFLFNDKKTNVLTFNTDLRSDKLKHCPIVSNDNTRFFESCFYFQGTWEQYRFNGEWLTISTNNMDINTDFLERYGIYKNSKEDDEKTYPTESDWEAELMRQWNSLSRKSKALYRKPAPGSLLTSETRKRLDKIQRGVDGASENAGLENFTMVCLCIDSVDYLNLKDGSGGERRIYQRRSERRHSIKSDHDDTDDDEDNNHTDTIEIWQESEVCP